MVALRLIVIFVLGSALLLAPAAAPVAAPAPQESAQTVKAAVGDIVPEHRFATFLSGGDGRQSLSDFRGQPVLVVNWTDTDFGRGASKLAQKITKQWGPKGLVCILRDTHNQSAQAIEAAVMRLYPGNVARLMANQKLPFEYQDNGPPPQIALIAVDGELLLAGSYTSDMGKVGKLLKEDLKRRTTGWGEHKAARAARVLAYGKQRLAEAMATIETALEAEPAQAELLEVRTEIATRKENWAKSVQFLMEQGQYIQALEEAQAFVKAAQGNADWESQSATLLRAFEGEEPQRELALEKKLSSLLKPLAKKKPKQATEKKLRAFAEAAQGTRVGARALRLADVAALALE